MVLGIPMPAISNNLLFVATNSDCKFSELGNSAPCIIFSSDMPAENRQCLFRQP